MIEITSPDGATRAGFIPEANLVCPLFEHTGIQLLDQAHGVNAYVDHGSTLGIPFLYPWANRLAGYGYGAAGRKVTLSPDDRRLSHDTRELPIHGVNPALLQWQVDPDRPPDELVATLGWASPELLALFPYEHTVAVRAHIGHGRLALETVVRATGGDRVPVSFGYHPYLALPGGRREAWRVELGATRHLLLDEQMIPTGEQEPVSELAFTLGDRLLDDGYAGLEHPAVFRVTSERGEITVVFGAGYPYAQVYAPPAKQFICFEPMTAPANALRSGDGLTVLEPGDEYRAEFSVAAVLR